MWSSRWTAALALVLVIGCGDSSGDGGAGAGGDSGQGGNGNPPACDAGTLCLDIVEEGAIPAARFAIVWFRLEGDVANDPTVALELPFDPSATSVEVSLSDVSLPPDLDKVCERDCAEPIDCPACTGDFEASVAYVMVVVDEDASGTIEPAEVAEPDNVVGIANTALVWSNSTAASVDAPFDALFPAGVVEGLEPYRINASGAFEPAGEGNVFELKIGPDVF